MNEMREIEKLSAEGKLSMNGRQETIDHEQFFSRLLSQLEAVDSS